MHSQPRSICERYAVMVNACLILMIIGLATLNGSLSTGSALAGLQGAGQVSDSD